MRSMERSSLSFARLPNHCFSLLTRLHGHAGLNALVVAPGDYLVATCPTWSWEVRFLSASRLPRVALSARPRPCPRLCCDRRLNVTYRCLRNAEWRQIEAEGVPASREAVPGAVSCRHAGVTVLWLRLRARICSSDEANLAVASILRERRSLCGRPSQCLSSRG